MVSHLGPNQNNVFRTFSISVDSNHYVVGISYITLRYIYLEYAVLLCGFPDTTLV